MADSQPHDLHSLVLSLERTLECAICEEGDRELRILTCCEKLVCLSCIEKVFADEEEKQLHEGTPICPFCQRTLTKKPQEYPANKMVQHFQAWATSLKYKEGKVECEVEQCASAAENNCKYCRHFICSRCSLESCPTTDDIHDVVGTKECMAESKESFDLWKAEKERGIKDLIVKRDEILDKVREHGQRLCDASNDSLAEQLQNIVSHLTQAQALLGKAEEKLSTAKSNLRFVFESFSDLSEVGLFHLVTQLRIFDRARKVSVGRFEPLIVNGGQFYDVALTSDGHLIVAKDGGIDVIAISDSDKPKVVRSIAVSGHAFSLVVHKGNIVVCVNSESQLFSTEIIILNSAYEEINRWKASVSTCDFTIAGDKLVFSSQISSNLKVFSMAGSALSSITWNGSSAGIAKMSSASIALADNKYNKVYRKQICTGDILWSAAVEKPFSMCVDINQNIWIRSNDKDLVTIISPQGDKLQAITDEGFTKLGEWTGIMVHAGYLYVCHADGVGRFELVYHSE